MVEKFCRCNCRVQFSFKLPQPLHCSTHYSGIWLYLCHRLFLTHVQTLCLGGKTDLDFLRWQGKVQKAQTIQDTCKKQEKVKNHRASLWDWVVNLPDKRRQLMFKYASLVGYCTTRAAFGPKGKGTIQWRWVTFETHLYIKMNYICYEFIIKKLVREWFFKKILVLEERFQRGKVVSFQRNYFVATKGVSVSTMHAEWLSWAGFIKRN